MASSLCCVHVAAGRAAARRRSSCSTRRGERQPTSVPRPLSICTPCIRNARRRRCLLPPPPRRPAQRSSCAASWRGSLGATWRTARRCCAPRSTRTCRTRRWVLHAGCLCRCCRRHGRWVLHGCYLGAGLACAGAGGGCCMWVLGAAAGAAAGAGGGRWALVMAGCALACGGDAGRSPGGARTPSSFTHACSAAPAG